MSPTRTRKLGGDGVTGKEALAAARAVLAMTGPEGAVLHGTATVAPGCGSRDPAHGHGATSPVLWTHPQPPWEPAWEPGSSAERVSVQLLLLAVEIVLD